MFPNVLKYITNSVLRMAKHPNINLQFHSIRLSASLQTIVLFSLVFVQMEFALLFAQRCFLYFPINCNADQWDDPRNKISCTGAQFTCSVCRDDVPRVVRFKKKPLSVNLLCSIYFHIYLNV